MSSLVCRVQEHLRALLLLQLLLLLLQLPKWIQSNLFGPVSIGLSSINHSVRRTWHIIIKCAYRSHRGVRRRYELFFGPYYPHCVYCEFVSTSVMNYFKAYITHSVYIVNL